MGEEGTALREQEALALREDDIARGEENPAWQLEASDLPGDFDLEDRHALRRVAGLSTELEDISEVEYRALRLERVVLIGVWADGSLDSAGELAAGAEAARRDRGIGGACGPIQRREPGRRRHLRGLGQGQGTGRDRGRTRRRHRDLRRRADPQPATAAGEPGRRSRSSTGPRLILDIFAQHARSREGKAQVELAQLQYMLPRLRGWGESLSRQAGGRVAGGGGIGTRGPGETKIETDRRRIRTRISPALSGKYLKCQPEGKCSGVSAAAGMYPPWSSRATRTPASPAC